MSVFLLATLCTAAAGGTIYVDAGAPGPTHDGTSWANAYNYLQDALAAAQSGDEIWVAEGIYKPDQGATVTPGDRTATFQLKNGVGVYGGFGGWETSREQRDWQTHDTILSGDLNGDDGPDFTNNAENSWHVVRSSWGDETAVLDGFTITGGKTAGGGWVPEDFGGGMCNWHSSPTVSNCTFTKNYAGWGGGGMFNETSSPTLTNCTFTGNWSYFGGGMRNDSSSPTLTNCTFSENYGSVGGGVFNYDGSPTVTNCTFSGNSASSGGGMHNRCASPTLTNCTFSGNNSAGFGGKGGGMRNNVYSRPTLTNCTFSGNSAPYGGGMHNNYDSTPTLINCTFSGNSAVYNGGGMGNTTSSSPTLTNCTFSGNSAGSSGGGMANNSNSTAIVTNCILWGDSAPTGAEIILMTYPGIFPFSYPSTLTISYSDVQGGAEGVYLETGCTLNWGTGNIAADPLFADADLRLSAGSPCINAGSNAALPPDTADLDGDGDTTEPIPLDLDGNARIFNGVVDMGAYESEGQGPSVITVEIDIKPGSYPSSINLQSKGFTPVAIHTTPDFDATTVDPTTVLLNYLVAPLMWEIYDCDEFENPDYGLPSEPEMIGDGDGDLVLYFDTQELVATGAVEVGDEWAILTGATFGGTPIEGMGDVNIVVKGKP